MAELPLVRVCGKYRLKRKIGSGSFGDVYFAVNVITGNEVAVKLEPTDTKESSLRLEQNVYKVLRDVEGIPKMLWFGVERGYRVLIMNLLGPSLADIFQASGCSFTLNTVLMLGIQL
ncbi:hypothetical protein H0H92_015050, partial [Tricholoma furcatifolium]